jgi:hypothetical protein
MTGLDLESFLRILRADLGAWMLLGLATLCLGMLVWSCRGSRRALRKCLVLSLAVHCGLVLYGSTVPALRWVFGADRSEVARRRHIRQIRVAPLVEPTPPSVRTAGATAEAARLAGGTEERSTAPRWELAAAPVGLADIPLRIPRPAVDGFPEQVLSVGRGAAAPVAVGAAVPRGSRLADRTTPPESRDDPAVKESSGAPPPSPPLPPNMAEVDRSTNNLPMTAAENVGASARTGPEAASSPGGIVLQSDRRLRAAPNSDAVSDRSADLAQNPLDLKRPQRKSAHDAQMPNQPRRGPVERGLDANLGAGTPLELARVTPKPRSVPNLAALGQRLESRTLPDVPRIYLPRLEPDRSTRAQRGGASAASELAVERALDWLARHQDDDGRWDGGIARYEDGSAAKGDHDFTIHCPRETICFGSCAYWEADTALTGLALLTYLGAGYTHKDGRYAEVVAKGLDFLLGLQKMDGDLRGPSRVVGMYCHAMATLSLCEAYALTGDDRLREPAERAVAFLVKARARDGLAWRYAPDAPRGDTSILGWVVMALKSAKETGIPIPEELSVRRGTLLWLESVATGPARGLARYQPAEPVTPTMTAEAWVCRQFLGVGGPGPTSSEAAEYLLRNESDRGPTNVYYWYYATLALYQHGGEPWKRWNSTVRDRIISLQCGSGHQIGSWEPDGSLYGAKGGRIYCTTLAALSLEVYYRYLRLYDAPKLPLEAGAAPGSSPRIPPRSALATPSSNPEDR